MYKLQWNWSCLFLIKTIKTKNNTFFFSQIASTIFLLHIVLFAKRMYEVSYCSQSACTCTYMKCTYMKCTVCVLSLIIPSNHVKPEQDLKQKNFGEQILGYWDYVSRLRYSLRGFVRGASSF